MASRSGVVRGRFRRTCSETQHRSHLRPNLVAFALLVTSLSMQEFRRGLPDISPRDDRPRSQLHPVKASSRLSWCRRKMFHFYLKSGRRRSHLCPMNNLMCNCLCESDFDTLCYDVAAVGSGGFWKLTQRSTEMMLIQLSTCDMWVGRFLSRGFHLPPHDETRGATTRGVIYWGMPAIAHRHLCRTRLTKALAILRLFMQL